MDWSGIKGYAFPPFCLINRCLAKVRQDNAEIVMITPLWPTQAWYGHLLEISIDFPILLPPLPNLLMSPQGEIHPMIQNGRLQLVAWKISNKISDQKGFHKKTKIAYRGPWEKWCSWANKRQINPTKTTVANIANFLTSQQQRGLEYSTLNTYRSAISAFHCDIDGCPIGQHPRIKQLLKGVFNRNPPKPRYLKTWDVDTVLNYIVTLGDNSELGLKSLSLKLVMLLALASTLRGSEIAMINPENIDDSIDHITIRFGDLTKTSKPNKPPRKIKLFSFSDNSRLDVTSCLRTYLDRTRSLRTSQSQKKQLFVAYTKPHNPVVTCSIARWIKLGLSQAGIDTNVYKAHSTRAASSSKAIAQGVSTEQIMKHANWARASTFQRFYQKPIVKDEQLEYQRKVVTLE